MGGACRGDGDAADESDDGEVGGDGDGVYELRRSGVRGVPDVSLPPG